MCFGNMHSLINLTKGFPCFFLTCNAYTRVKLANTGQDTILPVSYLDSVFCNLCLSMCSLCVNVYYITATRFQAKCS